MFIAILGRQPHLGMAELEHLYGAKSVKWFSDTTALITTDSFSIDFLGGTQKAGKIVAEYPNGDWRRISMQIVNHYKKEWGARDGKITLGISTYGFDVSARDVQKTGIILKQKLKDSGISLRLIPNPEPVLNSATSHHNKLGLSPNKVELLVVRTKSGRVCVAESIGAQNITSLARRDQGRPKRDAFVGMLPPKLAQILVNLASTMEAKPSRHTGPSPRLLDPFCGTGVVLQEAALQGYAVYGTDLAEKMVDYTRANLEWLTQSYHLNLDATVYHGDAMTTAWQAPIDLIACETYLGQPFSAPPSPEKLSSVVKNCNYIVSGFLTNLAPQLKPGTPLAIAVPAWKDGMGRFTRLPLIKNLEKLGYTPYSFANVRPDQLLYYREDQIVARELLVLIKA